MPLRRWVSLGTQPRRNACGNRHGRASGCVGVVKADAAGGTWSVLGSIRGDSVADALRIGLERMPFGAPRLSNDREEDPEERASDSIERASDSIERARDSIGAGNLPIESVDAPIDSIRDSIGSIGDLLERERCSIESVDVPIESAGDLLERESDPIEPKESSIGFPRCLLGSGNSFPGSIGSLVEAQVNGSAPPAKATGAKGRAMPPVGLRAWVPLDKVAAKRSRLSFPECLAEPSMMASHGNEWSGFGGKGLTHGQHT